MSRQESHSKVQLLLGAGNSFKICFSETPTPKSELCRRSYAIACAQNITLTESALLNSYLYFVNICVRRKHWWEYIQNKRSRQRAVTLVCLEFFSVSLKATPHKLITRLRQMESSTWPLKFVLFETKPSKRNPLIWKGRTCEFSCNVLYQTEDLKEQQVLATVLIIHQ